MFINCGYYYIIGVYVNVNCGIPQSFNPYHYFEALKHDILLEVQCTEENAAITITVQVDQPCCNTVLVEDLTLTLIRLLDAWRF